MKVIDLFCGCGGFSKGFEQVGFEIILGVDNWDRACESYQANFPKAEVWQRDVTTIKAHDLPEHDVIIGSPPCQEFSVARFRGVSKNKHADRSNVYFFMEMVQRLAPRYWVWENVQPVKKAFPQWRSRILDAQDYGVPQRRRRVFFGNYPIPPKKLKEKGIAPTILATEYKGGKGGHREFSDFISPTITATEYKGCKNDKRRAYREIIPTITRSFPHNIPRAGQCIEDFQLHRFTDLIDAMKYFQGMDGMTILGTKKEKSIQIGNAVCPPVARAIAEAILKKENDKNEIEAAANP